MTTAVANARRIVIKIGTNVAMRDNGHMATARLYAIAESIAELRHAGREVVLISSGAVGLGMHNLRFSGRPLTLALKQACAAVGQGRLTALYTDAFSQLGLASAQILLTQDDFSIPERWPLLPNSIQQPKWYQQPTQIGEENTALSSWHAK
jgi:glutamate 5-kinase